MIMVSKQNFYQRANIQLDLDASLNKVQKDDFTIVIPVLNEEKGIGRVIEEVKREGYSNILVVDGHSTDDTIHIVRKFDVRLIFQQGFGKTGAIKTAIENVRTPYFVVIDGDCTYDPRDIKKFFFHILKNDEVIGVRAFGKENIPFLNRFGNNIINSIFNLLFNTGLLDVCSGMYALRTNFARLCNLKSTGFEVEVEIAANVVRKGKIDQVLINYTKRKGKKKLCPWRDGLKIISTIIKLAISNNLS
ncbi:glycosyl transferase [Thaumarchaeota archaeon SCGC AB-539-E09]|nr:glycosyl transferase [Thaumarchaeota archaeon SCGC AB-539-E09]